jgi:hypothetical protein
MHDALDRCRLLSCWRLQCRQRRPRSRCGASACRRCRRSGRHRCRRSRRRLCPLRPSRPSPPRRRTFLCRAFRWRRSRRPASRKSLSPALRSSCCRASRRCRLFGRSPPLGGRQQQPGRPRSALGLPGSDSGPNRSGPGSTGLPPALASRGHPHQSARAGLAAALQPGHEGSSTPASGRGAAWCAC